jgi:hypothetical protein
LNLEEYEKLTGKAVPGDRRQDMDARIRAARVTVETLLGFSLEPETAKKNLYSAETAPVVGYRVFRFNPKDVYWPIDPASQIHSVKLIRPGEGPYTVTEFVAGSLEGNVRSESRGNRSFSRFDRVDPEKDPQVMRVLHRYAGPNGSLR